MRSEVWDWRVLKQNGAAAFAVVVRWMSLCFSFSYRDNVSNPESVLTFRNVIHSHTNTRNYVKQRRSITNNLDLII
jgi:hypothetical protein